MMVNEVIRFLIVLQLSPLFEVVNTNQNANFYI